MPKYLVETKEVPANWSGVPEKLVSAEAGTLQGPRDKYTILSILETLVDFVVHKTEWCGLIVTSDVKLCEL